MSNRRSEMSEAPAFGLDNASALPLASIQVFDAKLARSAEQLEQRFARGGAEAMPDTDLLELVLRRALDNEAATSLAKLLLDQFGDFNRVMAAPATRLQEVVGVTDTIVRQIKVVEAAAHRMAQSRVLSAEVLSSWDALLEYCKTRMAYLVNEHFRVLYLDRKNVLIADEGQQSGTVDHVPVYPREVIKRALELSASSLILVHNHPSGDPTPSEADVAMTQTIQTGAEILGIVLHDHLVIGQSGCFSFRSKGLI